MDHITFVKLKTQEKPITSSKCSSIRVPWKVARNIWIAFLVLLFYVIQEYGRPSITKNFLPSATTNKSDLLQKTWLQRYVADDEFADEVHSVLGDEISEELHSKINQQLNHLCAATSNETTDQIPIYVITPTNRRPEQEAELTRLAYTLMHVPNIYWLLCEDATKKSAVILELLEKWYIRSIHLLGGPREDSERTTGIVNCRNKALRWIRENADDGVLYFADDDNSYDIELFKEMRSTERVAMWPVGLSSNLGLSTPIVKNGKFVGFYDSEAANKTFPVDSAGFAVNVKFLKERPNAQMSVGEGVAEDSFLKSLVPFEPDEIELKANKCTEIFVWHLESVDYHPTFSKVEEKYAATNIPILKQRIV